MTNQPLPIEDYALIGDCVSAALVGRDGAIDWLCWPRFDSAACFAALLGTPDNGRWQIAPLRKAPGASRCYRPGSMVLETCFATAEGEVAVIDCMMLDGADPAILRIVEGRRGQVAMHMALTLRFDYGASVPWVERLADDSGLSAIAGPSRAVLRTSVPLVGEALATTADFTVAAGERVAFVLSHHASHLPVPPPIDAEAALAATDAQWRAWSSRMTYAGPFHAAVQRSLLTLKALTFAATGAIIAAPTTSLPEQLGGARNWDYRYCWLRDASLTLSALVASGYIGEAQAWRDWLHRAVAGSPAQLQIMYGIGGERRLDEYELSWLRGYQGAAPVRIGNAAAGQLQLDVYGELIGALHRARLAGLAEQPSAWAMQCEILEHLEGVWQEPDEGMWEVRGGRRQFTFSKVMAWLAFDCSIRDAERHGLAGPLDRWRAVRDEIHAMVCERGVDKARGCFTQSFGSPDLDASLLLIAHAGFLPVEDERVRATIGEIERTLVVDGFVQRYDTGAGIDGLPPGEGAFLPCSFWLADVMAMQGRHEEARALFERLLALRNDLGLLSEEYDPASRRLVGNFPQAFSHLALIRTASLVGAPIAPS